VGEPLDPPPSPRQGWGRLSLASSVVLAPEHGVDTSAADVPTAAVLWDESSARTLRAPGETLGFCLDVSRPKEALRGTIAWTDPAGDIVVEQVHRQQFST
jgi:hypothetical protein